MHVRVPMRKSRLILYALGRRQERWQTGKRNTIRYRCKLDLFPPLHAHPHDVPPAAWLAALIWYVDWWNEKKEARVSNHYLIRHIHQSASEHCLHAEWEGWGRSTHPHLNLLRMPWICNSYGHTDLYLQANHHLYQIVWRDVTWDEADPVLNVSTYHLH